ncbi:hypothetical protein EMPG_15102 [Blastomyces silverae]|uniref:N-acetyltransferase domain-containing protein n=1 Tax=Blastomyces silverae TaxID=2060906 RepID=A0A0H1BJZ0_9EURO|nr:hypothetical protein EMPG_15102 [Blastomyces silverae]
MTSFKIERITSPADAPVIGKIKTDAFESSTLSRYSFVWEGSGKAIVEKWYTDREEQDLQDPNQITIISVPTDQSTDLVNGEHRTSAGSPDKSHDRNSHHNNQNDAGNTHARTVAAWARFATPHPKPKNPDGSQEEPEYKKKKQYLIDNPPPGAHPELFTELRRQMVARRKKYLDEEKDYVLELIATSPAFERQGHASRLLKWGIEKADAENARVFLEATPAGLPLYERLGWRTVDTIRIKLADYGIDAEGDGGGYAILHIMIRDPQGKTASETKI